MLPVRFDTEAQEELVRRAGVKRFPYRVVFLMMSDHVRVLAIAHNHRRPGYWHKRI
jgi:hypothetical protein